MNEVLTAEVPVRTEEELEEVVALLAANPRRTSCEAVWLLRLSGRNGEFEVCRRV